MDLTKVEKETLYDLLSSMTAYDMMAALNRFQNKYNNKEDLEKASAILVKIFCKMSRELEKSAP